MAEHTEGELAGQTTYQILLHTESASDFVTAVSGDINNPMAIGTTTSFYQHILGGVTPENVNPLLLGNYPNLAFDSWVTIGLDGPANASNGESAAETLESPDQSWANIFDPGNGALGGSIVMDDEVGGIWYVLNGDANGTPSEDGTVLLGQFTTDGDVTGNMYIQVFPDGDNANPLTVNLPIGGDCVGESINPACEYLDDVVDCDGVCINDADEDGVCDEQEVAGCQDELACNFNPLATDDDGSCQVDDACGVCDGPGAIYECGCVVISEGDCDCNGNQLDALGECGGTCSADDDNDGTCDDVDECIGTLDACGICNGLGAIYECGCADIPAGDCDCEGDEGHEVVVTINPDNYGAEITWFIENEAGDSVASGGPYTNGIVTPVLDTIMLCQGCYTFSISDSLNDGICCLYGFGNYSLSVDNQLLIAGSGQYDGKRIDRFCIGQPTACDVAGTYSGALSGGDVGAEMFLPLETNAAIDSIEFTLIFSGGGGGSWASDLAVVIRNAVGTGDVLDWPLEWDSDADGVYSFTLPGSDLQGSLGNTPGNWSVQASMQGGKAPQSSMI